MAGIGANSNERSAVSDWSRSEDYKRWFARPLGVAYRESIEAALRPWIPGGSSKLALDAGCGPILTFMEVFERATSLVAVDCSFEVAKSARASLGASGRHGVTVCASIDHLPFGDGQFDFVLSLNCLEFVPDASLALAELHRVALPGARAVIGVLNRRGPWEWTRRIGQRLSQRAYYRGRFFGVEELTRALAEAGWRVEGVRYAVHFPPLALPHKRWFRWIARLVPDRRAGMILVQAVSAT
jgi:SAM-dependent methyltransferase